MIFRTKTILLIQEIIRLYSIYKNITILFVRNPHAHFIRGIIPYGSMLNELAKTSSSLQQTGILCPVKMELNVFTFGLQPAVPAVTLCGKTTELAV